MSRYPKKWIDSLSLPVVFLRRLKIDLAAAYMNNAPASWTRSFIEIFMSRERDLGTRWFHR